MVGYPCSLSSLSCRTLKNLLQHHSSKHQFSRFDARYWMLGAGAMGRPSGMVWGGRKEEGSGWGTQVYLWWIHFDIWQNQYNIIKLKNKIKWKKENAIIWILIRRDREEFDLTEKSFLSYCHHGGRDCTDAATIQEDWGYQKLEVKRNTFSPRPSGECLGLSAHRFQPSETDYRLLTARKGDSTFLLFSSHRVCGSLLQQP